VISLATNSIDLPFRFPIYPSGRILASSTAFTSLSPTIVSRILPVVFRREIGLHPPGVRRASGGLPGFGITTTFTVRNCRGKCSSWRLAVARVARALYSFGPYACRKPTGRPSVPGAFHGAVRRRAYCTSSADTMVIKVYNIIGHHKSHNIIKCINISHITIHYVSQYILLHDKSSQYPPSYDIAYCRSRVLGYAMLCDIMFYDMLYHVILCTVICHI
jgi:hypothetical protein